MINFEHVDGKWNVLFYLIIEFIVWKQQQQQQTSLMITTMITYVQ